MTIIGIPATQKLPLNLSFRSMAARVLRDRFATVITREDVDRWCAIYDDPHPWYRESSPWGPPIAPADILYYVSQNVIAASPEIEQAAPSAGGGGLARYQAEFLAPVPIDRPLTVSAAITDRFVRRGRGYLEWRSEVRAGDLIIQRDCKTWLVGLSPTEAADQEERPSDPRQPAGRQAVELIGPRLLPISADRLANFEGPDHPNDTTHTNLALAQAAGFPNVRAQGAIPFGLLSRLLLDRFGERFLAGGSIDLRLLQAIYAGETLAAFAEIVEPEAESVHCRLRAENPAGQLIAAGQASVPR